MQPAALLKEAKTADIQGLHAAAGEARVYRGKAKIIA